MMTSRNLMWKGVCKLFSGIVLFTLVIGGYLYYSSQVHMNSYVITQQVQFPVIITVDESGVPFIEAETITDAIFAIGYVQAHFRLWQVDISRRTATGRLSEIIGAAAYDIDEFFRTLGIARVASRNYPKFTEKEKLYTQAFCDGLNYGVEQLSFLPVEYYATWSSWDPYQPTDVLSQFGLITYVLAPGWSKELLRQYITDALGDVAANILLPFELKNLRDPVYIVNDEEIPEHMKTHTEKPETKQSKKGDKKENLKRGFEDAKGVKLDLESPVLASNSWVISGEHTASGKPLLANDPHLPTNMPSFWFFIDFKVKGVTHVRGGVQPGTYSFGLGRNDHVAWTVTSLKVDAIDLYRETRNPNNPEQFLYDGQWFNFAKVREVIKVKGLPDQYLELEVSKHGPLLAKGKPIPSVSPNLHKKDIDEDIAICWTMHHIEDHSAGYFIDIMLETNVDKAIENLQRMRSPALSLVFASDSGDIWFSGIGTIPIRDQFNSLPLDGSDSKNDWKGFVPGNEMPFVKNPKKGYIVTANNYPMGPSYKHFFAVGSEFSEGRAERISELIQAKIDKGEKLTPDDMLSIQQDEVDVHCRDALPEMLKFTEHSAFWDEMSNWNCTHSKDLVEPHVFFMWLRLFSGALVRDEIPDFADSLVGSMWYRYTVTRMMKLYTTDKASLQTERWCDDSTTQQRESCSELLSSTFKQAVEAVGNVRWGQVHATELKHAFSSIAVLKYIFHRSVEVGGSDVTPHATTSPISTTFSTLWGPNSRVVMDLGTSEFIWALESGQHGSVLSKHYDSMLSRFHYGPLIHSYFDNNRPEGDQVRIEPKSSKTDEL